MNWNDLKYYLAVARTNSITDAAEKLGVSPSTVSRRISILEKDLGIALFNKRPSGYFQTRSSLKIYKIADEIELNIFKTQRIVKNDINDNFHVVKVNMPELLGNQIIPELRLLQKKEPTIRFELINNVRNTKLSTRSNDIVVRYGRPDSGAYKIKKIGLVSRALFCSKKYIEEHGIPKFPSDLTNHFLIGWDKEMDNLPLAKWCSSITKDNKYWMIAPNLNAQLEAVVSGLGIAALPNFVAVKYELVQLFPDIPSFDTEIFLMKSMETESYKSVKILANCIENSIRSKETTIMTKNS